MIVASPDDQWVAVLGWPIDVNIFDRDRMRRLRVLRSTSEPRSGSLSPDGAILAIPVSDTVKQADDDLRIEKTVSRSRLWRAQTPQLFPIRRLAKALADALSDKEAPTDEASAMERQGARPRLVMGSQFNIKITGPEDLSLAEVLLRHLMADGHGLKQKHALASRSRN